MKEKIKSFCEKMKEISLITITLIVSFIVYWLGVSLSFLLWKLSTLRKKKRKDSYWSEYEEVEENYESEY